jgi:hypothetical protein
MVEVIDPQPPPAPRPTASRGDRPR